MKKQNSKVNVRQNNGGKQSSKMNKQSSKVNVRQYNWGKQSSKMNVRQNNGVNRAVK
jgi:hypothetical protein